MAFHALNRGGWAKKTKNTKTRGFGQCAPLVEGADNPYLSAPQRCNAQRSDAQRKLFTTLSISLFLQRHRCDALPCFSASPVEFFTSHTSPFGLCFHFSFRHNGLLYKTTRNLPRVTTQRCRHWQREMANANANANAAMRCTKTHTPLIKGVWVVRESP